MNKYFIAFARTPTSYNHDMTIHPPTLRGVLVRVGDRVELTPEYRSAHGFSGHVVFDVYRYERDVKVVYYNYRHYQRKTYISTQLDAMLDPELEEKLV